jgi:hypothetical protein
VPYYCYFVFINLLKIIHERKGIRARAGGEGIRAVEGELRNCIFFTKIKILAKEKYEFWTFLAIS